MSGSESDALSTPANLPDDDEIEQCLRRTVREALKKDEEITINLARSRAEKELGLGEGFFKENDPWKKRSKELISAAVEEPASPERPKKSAPRSKPAAKAGTKRKSDEVPKQRKRVKKSPVVDSEEAAGGSAVEDYEREVSEPEDIKAKTKVQTKSEEESALSEPPDDESEPAAPKTNGKPAAAEGDDDSDLSSVIDDPPPKKTKGRQKKSTSPRPPKSSKVAKSTTKSSIPKPDLSPEEEEIKRLQSWLLKCGVRKLWHRELAPYPTPKEKIKHLKKMLEDVGMSGRYSVEKARQIKEARELKAELDAAKTFNEQWGHGSGDEEGSEDGVEKKKEDVDVQPRRLKPKGLVDFGDSDEESD